jgi:hypothetical protein
MIDLKKDQEISSTHEETDEEIVRQIYAFARNLLFEKKMKKRLVINELINNGVEPGVAKIIVKNLISFQNEGAKKDMLYGILWCIGGTVATIADIGFIFWGAIVFGAIQFFEGLVSLRWK